MNWKEVINGITEGITWSIGILLVFLPFMYYMPQIETRYFPVVDNFKIVNRTIKQDHIEYEITFDKKRDCDLIPRSLTWYYYDKLGMQVRARISFPEDYVASRNEGKQRSIWRVSKPKDSHKNAITFEHQCYLAWKTKSRVELND